MIDEKNIYIDGSKKLDESWKIKLKKVTAGGVLALTSLLANAEQDPQNFGKLMAKCSAINYIAAEVAKDAGAPASLVNEFQRAFLKTNKMGKQLLGDGLNDTTFKKETDNLIKRSNNGGDKVNAINLIKDLQMQSGVCEAMRGSVENGTLTLKAQPTAEQISKFWTDVKDYKGGKDKNGLPHGTGKLVWTDGGSYTGGWSNGYHNGEGVVTLPSGAKFEGIFNMNVKERGTYTFRDGSKFVGEFMADGNKFDNGRGYDASGKEIYTYVNGKRIETPKEQPQSKTKLSPEELRAQFKADAMKK